MEKRNVTVERNGIELFFMNIKDFIKHHRKPVLLVFLAVMLLSGLLIAGSLYYDVRSERELRSYEEIVSAYEISAKDDAAFTLMMDKLTPLVDGSRFGYLKRHGDFILAGYNFDKKKYDDAEKRYLKYAEKSKSAYAPLSLLQAGLCAEEQNKFDKALETYKKAEEKFKDSAFADRVLFDLGRMYQKKGEIVSAREAFTKILTQHPKSPFIASAKARLFLLGLK